MLHPTKILDPPPRAYALPWHVDRHDRPHPALTNAGDTDVDFVRVFYNTPRGERTRLWGRVSSGERRTLCLCEADLDDVVITLAWFRREDGLEYLWRFVV